MNLAFKVDEMKKTLVHIPYTGVPNLMYLIMPLLHQPCFTFNTCIYSCFLNHSPAASERPFGEGTHLLPVNKDVPEDCDSGTVLFLEEIHACSIKTYNGWWLENVI